MNSKDRQIWEQDVRNFFEEGMQRLQNDSIVDKPRARFKEQLLTSYLSDIQELIVLNPQQAIEEINTIKFIENNCH
jgi:hypothetical protein